MKVFEKKKRYSLLVKFILLIYKIYLFLTFLIIKDLLYDLVILF